MWGTEPMIDKSRQQLRFLHPRAERGFSLVELLVVVVVITIIMGSVLKSINLAQQTSASQQVQLDLTQQAREFVDQLTRDLHNLGYPYVRNMANGMVDPNNTNSAPYNTYTSAYDPYNAPGLIYVNNGAPWFAGDIDGTENYDASGNPQGTAQVKIVRYDLISTGNNCPCLRRTEFLRNGGDPYTDAQNLGSAVQQLEIQGVQNGTSASNAIFTVYDTSGNPITLPIDFNSGSTIASINSIKVVLTLQSPNKDSTGGYPTTTVVASIALHNCSEAMVNGQLPPYCG